MRISIWSHGRKFLALQILILPYWNRTIHILLQKQDLAYRVYRRAPRKHCGARGSFPRSVRKILEIFSNPLTES